MPILFLLLLAAGFADVFETAAFAVRFARRAYFSAVQHKPMTEITGFLRGNERPQSFFYFCRLFDAVNQPDAVGEANAVRIRDNGGLMI